MVAASVASTGSATLVIRLLLTSTVPVPVGANTILLLPLAAVIVTPSVRPTMLFVTTLPVNSPLVPVRLPVTPNVPDTFAPVPLTENDVLPAAIIPTTLDEVLTIFGVVTLPVNEPTVAPTFAKFALPVAFTVPETLAPVVVTVNTLLVPPTLTATLLLLAIRTLLLPFANVPTRFPPVILPVAVILPAVPKLPTLALPVTLNAPAVVKLPPLTLPVALTTPAVVILPPETLPVEVIVPATLIPVPVTTTTFALPATLMVILPLAEGIFKLVLPLATGPITLLAVKLPITVNAPLDVNAPFPVRPNVPSPPMLEPGFIPSPNSI